MTVAFSRCRARRLSCAHRSNQCRAVCGRALRERLTSSRASVVSWVCRFGSQEGRPTPVRAWRDDALNYRRRWQRCACEPFTVLRTSAARSREAWTSASDSSSTKCSGLLVRSSFAILAARARHRFSVAPMPAFSVASRPSNPSHHAPNWLDPWLAAICNKHCATLFIPSRPGHCAVPPNQNR